MEMFRTRGLIFRKKVVTSLGKGKGKVHPRKATKAQRRSTDIALLFL
jgi:hypothetical protein